MNEAINMIEKLIAGNCDPLDFSYKFPDYLVENYDAMLIENSKLTGLLNDNFPEICADFERGADEEAFKSKVKKEYGFILAENKKVK